MNKLGKKSIAFTLFALGLLCSLSYYMWYHGLGVWKSLEEPKISILPKNDFDRTIVVVGDVDFDPYSFVDHNGKNSGYDTELIYALANHMKVNVDLRLMSWSNAQNALASGSADIIMGYHYKVNDPYFKTSIPMHNDQFVAFGKKNLNISSFYNMRIATIKGSGSYDDFIVPYGLDKNTKLFESYSEAFASLASGDSDYVISRYSVGRRATARLGEDKIAQTGMIVLNNLICFAVRSDDQKTLNELNHSIIALYKDGTIDRLNYKWLGDYVQVITLRDFIAMYANEVYLGTIIFVLLITGWSLLINWRQKKIKDHLKIKTRTDILTGLNNKESLCILVEQQLQRAQPGQMHAFLCFDIDNFKGVNDTFGHLFGDEVLKEVADKMKLMFRSSDILGRFGGDEFVLFMQNICSVELAKDKAAELLNVLRKKYVVGEKELYVSVSIGMAIFPKDGTTYDQLYLKADSASYAAKANGKDQLIVYEEIQ